jgi:hypothetical protein
MVGQVLGPVIDGTRVGSDRHVSAFTGGRLYALGLGGSTLRKELGCTN